MKNLSENLNRKINYQISGLNDELYSQFSKQLKIYWELRSQRYSQIRSQLDSQLGNQLDRQLYNQFSTQIDG